MSWPLVVLMKVKKWAELIINFRKRMDRIWKYDWKSSWDFGRDDIQFPSLSNSVGRCGIYRDGKDWRRNIFVGEVQEFRADFMEEVILKVGQTRHCCKNVTISRWVIEIVSVLSIEQPERSAVTREIREDFLDDLRHEFACEDWMILALSARKIFQVEKSYEQKSWSR